MKLQIECTALQLKTIGEALHMFDYSIIVERDKIPKHGWALANICEDWIIKEKQLILMQKKDNNV